MQIVPKFIREKVKYQITRHTDIEILNICPKDFYLSGTIAILPLNSHQGFH